MATAIPTPATPALLTLEEYLHTSYHPDCDFVDGRLEERTMGTPKHALLRMWLGFWFLSHQREWKVRVMGDVRTRVGANRVRLPDVAVVRDEVAIPDRVWGTPPLIAIEILSPDDRLSSVQVRLQDFLDMGGPFIWLLDPIKRTVHTYTNGGLRLVEGPRLTLPDSPIHLDLPELFSALD